MIKSLRGIHWLLTSVILLISAFAIHISGGNSDESNINIPDIQAGLDAKFDQSKTKAQQILQDISRYNTIPENDPLLGNDFEAVFIYQDDSLLSWSSHLVPEPPAEILQRQPKEDWVSIELSNGWYVGYYIKSDSLGIIVLSGIYSDYRYNNNYLSDQLLIDGVEGKASIKAVSDAKEEEFHLLYNPDKTPCFTIGNLRLSGMQATGNPLVMWLFIIGLGVLFFTGGVFISKITQKVGNLGGVFVLMAVLVSIRALLFTDAVDLLLAEYGLFNPVWYASSAMFPSLGDFLINALIFFTVVLFFHRNPPMLSGLFENTFGWLMITGLSSLGLLFISREILLLGTSLIQDSTLNFNVTNILALDAYSYIGFLCLGLLFFANIILALGIAGMLIRSVKPENKTIFIIILLTGISYTLILLSFSHLPVLLNLWPGLVLCITLLITIKIKSVVNSFTGTLSLLTLFSLITAFLITHYTESKEREYRQTLASRIIESEDDPMTEINFESLEHKLISDSLISSFIKGDVISKESLVIYLEDKYFYDFWDSYEIEYYLYQADSAPTPFDPYALSKDLSVFLRDIDIHCSSSEHSTHLFKVNDYFNKLSHIAFLPIGKDSATGFLTAEFRSKQLPDDIGFPELLIDKNTKTIQELTRYSIARYSGNKLVTRLGDFNYPVDGDYYFSKISDSLPSPLFLQEQNTEHLMVRGSGNSLLIISKSHPTILQQATTFSYLFVMFGFIIALYNALKMFRTQKWKMLGGLNAKIRALMVGISLVTLILFGIGTRYFILEEYTEKNNRLISEKLSSVHEEMRKKVGKEPNLNTDMRNYLNFALKRFSEVFFTDITLYDSGGKMLATSRNEVFHAGLLSERMNPVAFKALHSSGQSEFIHEEHIGKLHYLNAYTPFLNYDGEVMGYISLPYFAKQNPLENEISNLLVTLINIFVLLMVLSIIAMLFVANWVTRPLKVLQDGLSSIQLGKINRKLEYHGQDEIGSLVNVYNQKVAELQLAAEALAQSERETAWREMARQVAHEIKNPLTPMKLSVQHFQRSFNKDAEDARERLDRFSKMLIEQIETLTHIADEFSAFAKMPKSQAIKMDIVQGVQQVVELFGAEPNVQILFSSNVSSVDVLMDKDEVTRIFTNLIKNAVQSIPAGKPGRISVTMALQNTEIEISVTDNGSGIPDDVRERIFQPYFTTKTGGTGLGLAMIKNIIQNTGGTVRFVDNTSGGTTFIIKLPVAG